MYVLYAKYSLYNHVQCISNSDKYSPHFGLLLSRDAYVLEQTSGTCCLRHHPQIRMSGQDSRRRHGSPALRRITGCDR